jgi:hypothetical protein
MLRRIIVVLLVVAFGALGCSKKESTETAASSSTAAKTGEAAKTVSPKPAPPPSQDTTGQDDYIVVQHILIAFDGSIPGKNVERSKVEARELAQKLYERVQAGEDFDALVKEYTDDSHPGIYKMANFGIPPNPGERIYARAQMVRAFGDVGFPLKVGEIGLAEWDPETSKYGWHIIKRIE